MADELTIFDEEVEKLAAELKPEWLVYARHYLETNNSLQSYLEAYPHVDRKVAGVNSTRLKQHPKVAAYIREVRRQQARSSLMSLEEVQARIQAQAFADITQFIGWTVVDSEGGGTMAIPEVKMSSDEVPEEVRGLIKGVVFTKMGPKFEMADQQRAQDMLLKIMGAYKERIDHTSSDGTMSPQGSDVTDALKRKYEKGE